jgi:hypothetical protein
MDDATLVPLIERLAGEIAARVSPRIPLSVDLWDIETVAAYLKISVSRMRNHYAALPDFPPAIRLPGVKGKYGHPRWKAMDVIRWAEARTVRKPRP